MAARAVSVYCAPHETVSVVLTLAPTEPPLETTEGPRFPGASRTNRNRLLDRLKMGSRRELMSVYCQCTAK
jgi:hypothetical protein